MAPAPDTSTLLSADGQATAPSPWPGMGAALVDGGCSFRTWAPHAARVWLVSDATGWQRVPLARDSDSGRGASYFSVFVPGVSAGAEYRFVIENCGCGPGNPGGVSEHGDPWALDSTHSHGHSRVIDRSFDWNDGDFSMPPWHELVIYQLHIGTFAQQEDGTGGTFASAQARLQHLHDLGINAIQLLPIKEFPGDQSWGYNPSCPFNPEESYGTPEELKAFVDAAHALGMAVILDLVFNHFGPDLGSAGLWRYDGWHHDDFGGIYFYNDWRARTPWDEKTRPDFGREEVRDWLLQSALYWLHDYHVDGFRWDATAYIRDVDGNDHAPATALADGWRFMQDTNAAIKRDCPWKISIAEDLKGSHAITAPGWEGGAGFDSQWDAGFHARLLAAVLPQRDEERDLDGLAAALGQRLGGHALARVIYSENHDEVGRAEGHPDKIRLPERIHPGQADSWWARKRSTLAASIVLTAPGIPMLFQGQEFLAAGWWGDQVALDWDKGERFAGLVQLYRDLIRLRRNWHDHSRGLRGQHLAVFHRNRSDQILAYHRWQDGGPGDDVVVVANFSTHPHHDYRIGFPRAGTWWLRFNSDAAVYATDFASIPVNDVQAQTIAWDGLSHSATIAVPPYSMLIFSQ